jgi:acyl-CoA dehydrogenase
MDFQLDEERNEFEKLAREFAERELTPKAHACEMARVTPTEILKKAFDTGLLNVQIPEEQGGLGLDLWNAALIAQGLASGCSSIASAIEFSTFAQIPILLAGTKKQQEKFLQPLNESLSFGGIDLDSIVEPGPLTVSGQGDKMLVNGLSKRMLNAGLASWFVVAALDSDSSEVFFLVVESKTAGCAVQNKVSAVGRTLADVCTVKFENVVVTEKIVSEDISKLRRIVLSHVNILIAAGLTGTAQSALDNAVRYANERKTFGKNISQHQSIGFMLADIAKNVSAARLLFYKAAALTDNHMDSYVEALTAHSFASEIAMQAATDAVQIYGGYGYSREYPVEKLMRDVKAYQTLTTGNHMLKSELGNKLLAAST